MAQRLVENMCRLLDFCLFSLAISAAAIIIVSTDPAQLMGRTLRVDHTKDYEPPEVRKLRQQERDRQRGKEVEEAAEDGLNPKELLLKQLRGEAPAPRRGALMGGNTRSHFSWKWGGGVNGVALILWGFWMSRRGRPTTAQDLTFSQPTAYATQASCQMSRQTRRSSAKRKRSA